MKYEVTTKFNKGDQVLIPFEVVNRIGIIKAISITLDVSSDDTKTTRIQYQLDNNILYNESSLLKVECAKD